MGAEVKATLSDLVDPSNLPPYLGGRCCCAECSSGSLRGGSMWAWEQEAQAQSTVAETTSTWTPHAPQAAQTEASLAPTSVEPVGAAQTEASLAPTSVEPVGATVAVQGQREEASTSAVFAAVEREETAQSPQGRRSRNCLRSPEQRPLAEDAAVRNCKDGCTCC